MSIQHLGAEAKEKCADSYSSSALYIHSISMVFGTSIMEAGHVVINFSSPLQFQLSGTSSVFLGPNF